MARGRNSFRSRYLAQQANSKGFGESKQSEPVSNEHQEVMEEGVEEVSPHDDAAEGAENMVVEGGVQNSVEVDGTDIINHPSSSGGVEKTPSPAPPLGDDDAYMDMLDGAYAVNLADGTIQIKDPSLSLVDISKHTVVNFGAVAVDVPNGPTALVQLDFQYSKGLDISDPNHECQHIDVPYTCKHLGRWYEYYRLKYTFLYKIVDDEEWNASTYKGRSIVTSTQSWNFVTKKPKSEKVKSTITTVQAFERVLEDSGTLKGRDYPEKGQGKRSVIDILEEHERSALAQQAPPGSVNNTSGDDDDEGGKECFLVNPSFATFNC